MALLLYAIRHGQTNWNVEKKWQGRTDTALNAVGKKQAETLAHQLKDTHIDVILSSPLQRAFETATTLNRYHQVDIHIEPKLIERNFGDLEGVVDIRPFHCDLTTLLDYSVNYHLHHVEPIQEVFARVTLLLEELQVKFPNKTVLLATHDGVLQVLECILKKLPKHTDLKTLSLGNCDYRVYPIS